MSSSTQIEAGELESSSQTRMPAAAHHHITPHQPERRDGDPHQPAAPAQAPHGTPAEQEAPQHHHHQQQQDERVSTSQSVVAAAAHMPSPVKVTADLESICSSNLFAVVVLVPGQSPQALMPSCSPSCKDLEAAAGPTAAEVLAPPQPLSPRSAAKLAWSYWWPQLWQLFLHSLPVLISVPLVVILAFAIPFHAVQSCHDPFLLGDASSTVAAAATSRASTQFSVVGGGGSANTSSIPQEQVDPVTSASLVDRTPPAGGHSALVLADVHVATMCPFSDLGMRARRYAAERVHHTKQLFLLGDLMSFGGGADGSINITNYLFRMHARRLRRITGCSWWDMHQAHRCVVIPGNHDLEHDPTRRYRSNYATPNRRGSMDHTGGRGQPLSYYMLNSMHRVMPAGMNATLLLSHHPVSMGIDGSLLDGTPSLLAGTRFELILSGHTHFHAHRPASVPVAGVDAESPDAHGRLPPEFIVPSFNPFSSLTASRADCEAAAGGNCIHGKLGFGLLHFHADGRLHSYQLCTPYWLSTYILLACVSAVGMAVAAWRKHLRLNLALLAAAVLFTFIGTYFDLNKH